MSRWRRLTAKEVRTIVRNLGFTLKSTEGGHEHWAREQPPPFRKVTIDVHVAPFGPVLIRYMANQAGVSKAEFYAALDK